MQDRVVAVSDCIRGMDGVTICTELSADEYGLIAGAVDLAIPNGALSFDVQILPSYSFQIQGRESILFVNGAFKEYNHVNPDGSICVHTTHSPDLVQKLQLDFAGLKNWIETYYLENTQDDHYEHIFLPSTSGKRDAFLFTDLDYVFQRGDYGTLTYSTLREGGRVNETSIDTHLIHGFRVGKARVACQWAEVFQKTDSSRLGAFVFLEDAPVSIRRYAYTDWREFIPVLNQRTLNGLRSIIGSVQSGSASIPLLVGYRVSDTEIHWQALWLRFDNLPFYGKKNPVTKQWETGLDDMPIEWCETHNCSYRLFFGRGALSPRLTDVKILIVGVGAIGSMVATTLARGGCKHLCIVDNDIKEPGNVCRSEYAFSEGLGNKVDELRFRLNEISPFVEVTGNTVLLDGIKLNFHNGDDSLKPIQEHLGTYDVVFDCTAENDIAYILSKSVPDTTSLINLSITNHAKELVCTTSPNAYQWMLDIFQKLNNDSDDFFNPTGCWSPTFKASYNDIAVLVQYAIKHINHSFERGTDLRNFYLSTSDEDGFSIKANLF